MSIINRTDLEQQDVKMSRCQDVKQQDVKFKWLSVTGCPAIDQTKIQGFFKDFFKDFQESSRSFILFKNLFKRLMSVFFTSP